jgi:hypothetical protein
MYVHNARIGSDREAVSRATTATAHATPTRHDANVDDAAAGAVTAK